MMDLQALLLFNLIAIRGMVQIGVRDSIPVLDAFVNGGDGTILASARIDIGLRLRYGKSLLNISLSLVDGSVFLLRRQLRFHIQYTVFKFEL